MKKRLPMNLQFFANEEVDQDTNNQPGGEQETTPTEEAAKTFNQEDVNNIASKESKKATEKLLKDLGIENFKDAKDGLAKFRKWQEEQKTDKEKQDEEFENLKKTNSDFETENSRLKSQISAMKQGVNADSVEDVVALAERLVNDDVTIDDAIKQVIEKYPHFVGQAEEKPNAPRIVTSGNPRGGSSPTDSDPFAAKMAKYN